MHKTIEEINLGLSTLRVTFSKDYMDPFNIVNETLKAFPSIARIENPNAIEYKCGAEQFIIKLTEEDRIAILERYCLDNPLVNSFEAFLRLEDSKKTVSGWSVYKFVDITPRKLN